MTTLYEAEKICAICGIKSKHTVIGSTNAFGSPDLDLRPPMMQRATMRHWVQECPNCGYANHSIEEKLPNAEATLSSEAYKEIKTGPLKGTLIGRFLRASLISKGALDLDAAANYALNAAWAADDSRDIDAAISHRNLAADLMLASLSGKSDASERDIVHRARLVDVLRRARRWTEAQELATSLLEKNLDSTIRSVLKFGALAASRKDSECYTIVNALDQSKATKLT
jgi:hypothetical protein